MATPEKDPPGQAGALPKVHAHPQDEAENWLAETYENADDPSVGYDRGEMIDAYHSGWQRFRELVTTAVREALADAVADATHAFAKDEILANAGPEWDRPLVPETNALEYVRHLEAEVARLTPVYPCCQHCTHDPDYRPNQHTYECHECTPVR